MFPFSFRCRGTHTRIAIIEPSPRKERSEKGRREDEEKIKIKQTQNENEDFLGRFHHVHYHLPAIHAATHGDEICFHTCFCASSQAVWSFFFFLVLNGLDPRGFFLNPLFVCVVSFFSVPFPKCLDSYDATIYLFFFGSV